MHLEEGDPYFWLGEITAGFIEEMALDLTYSSGMSGYRMN